MSELDLDQIGHLRFRLGNHVASSKPVTVDCRCVDELDALIAELRKLREENVRLKAFAEAVVENFDCDCEELPTGETCFWCKAKEALPKEKP